jgi:hypothetical protein
MIFADSSTPDLTGPTDLWSIAIAVVVVALVIGAVVAWASVIEERRTRGRRARRPFTQPSHVRIVRDDD